DRKTVFDKFFGAYQVFESSLGAALAAQVQSDIFKARSRGFATSLQATLFTNDIPEGVYRTLVAEANTGLPALHRYFDIRRRRLGLDEVHYYDLNSPLAERQNTDAAPEDRYSPLRPG